MSELLKKLKDIMVAADPRDLLGMQKELSQQSLPAVDDNLWYAVTIVRADDNNKMPHFVYVDDVVDEEGDMITKDFDAALKVRNELRRFHPQHHYQIAVVCITHL